MPNGWNTRDILKTTESGEYDKEDVDQYLSGLFSDFSRLKTMWEKQCEMIKEEKNAVLDERDKLKNEKITMAGDIDAYVKRNEELNDKIKGFESKLAEMEGIQSELTRTEEERSALIQRINEVEEKNSQNMEAVSDLTKVREELEKKNAELEKIYGEALTNMSELTREKEEAIANETMAKSDFLRKQEEHKQTQTTVQKLLSELQSAKDANDKLLEDQQKVEEENIRLASDVSQLKTMNQELEKTLEEAGSEGDNPETDLVADEPYCCQSLMTNSGFELLDMLRTLSDNMPESGSGVKVSQSWEEEQEEIIPNADAGDGHIVKKTRKKTEVSVEYRPSGKDR